MRSDRVETNSQPGLRGFKQDKVRHLFSHNLG